ncbi:hypothetical protein TrCOL_g5244 [Triparma columacea]|uniref:Uncharacterized protein n=1 Tax=Triparma columacea TaxID=722753 RepID=A0A9W7G649_9STRA|nr:hypothetical protein TrCOL_g5244 [Triparma columacea]
MSNLLSLTASHLEARVVWDEDLTKQSDQFCSKFPIDLVIDSFEGLEICLNLSIFPDTCFSELLALFSSLLAQDLPVDTKKMLAKKHCPYETLEDYIVGERGEMVAGFFKGRDGASLGISFKRANDAI